ncbi:MAG: hypothetical protein ABIN91_09570 [Mucilaginibacter sp.]|uniref:hypothetical protein n=1 Tax=Mucilaginibacter sp. TaxID=1882438 RepID=UPI003263FC80
MSNHHHTSEPLLSGLFTDRLKAELAFEELIRMGYKPEEISVAMASTAIDKMLGEDKSDEQTETPFDGTADGAITGGMMGGIAFTIGALGSNLLIPGLGLVAMGPVAAGILGVGAGGALGGIIGKLFSSDQQEERASLYADGLKHGKILIALYPHNDKEGLKLGKRWLELSAEIIEHPDKKLLDPDEND